MKKTVPARDVGLGSGRIGVGSLFVFVERRGGVGGYRWMRAETADPTLLSALKSERICVLCAAPTRKIDDGGESGRR